MSKNILIKEGLTTKEEYAKTKDNRINNAYDDFVSDFCPFGSRDIRASLKLLDQYDIDKDLNDIIEDYCESVGLELKDKNDLDVCAIAYEHVLQEVRNEIINIIDFDIQNDCDFEVAGNYMCSSFDYREEDKESLINAIKEADEDKQKELFESDIIMEFFNDVDMDIEVKKLINKSNEVKKD